METEFALLIAAAEQAGPGRDCDLYRDWISKNSASPHLFAAWFNLGASLSRDGAMEDAAISYRNAAALRPDFHPARLNLGLALERLGRPDDALDAWGAALQPDVDRIALLNQRARLNERQGRLAEAEHGLRASLLTSPAQPDAVQHWVHIRQKGCMWPVADPLPGLDADALRRGAGPLGALALTDDVDEQCEAAAGWIARKLPPAPERLSPAVGYRHERIRIGYLSSDFCRHAMSFLIAELLEKHDRSKFEVFGYCSSPEDHSPLRRRVLDAFDRVTPVGALSDEAAARAIAADEIDVLIDLNGLTAGSRLGVMRWRPAPVQATYLGYVGPIPLPELDYILCDEIVVPKDRVTAYRPTPLPVGPVYQANDTRRGAAPTPSRASLGLPERGFVFCCFSNHYKVTEPMFMAWMRILHASPGSVLWLAADTSTSRENLVRHARAAGIPSDRLVFADRCDPDLYMGRLAAADLFLDTFPYNAGTVASDALRMGLPLVTLTGRAFASRMATSLLHHLGAADFAASTLDAYETLAIALATNPERYNACKLRFSRAAWDRTLGDVASFVSHYEAALSAVVRQPARETVG